MEKLILTIDVVGKLLIGWAALRVHHRVLNEHKIDIQVFLAMKREQWLGISGMVCIVAAYILHLIHL
jgi:hypothetical protein